MAPIFEDDCYADLIWSGERPPAIYAMSSKVTSTAASLHQPFSKSIALPCPSVSLLAPQRDLMSRILPLKTDAAPA
jgi:2-aminoadipate transaminase